MSDLTTSSSGVASGAFLQALENAVVYLGELITALQDLKIAGGIVPTLVQDSNGLFPTALPITSFRNVDGSALGAAAAVGKFGYAITLGTSAAMVGEAALANTKTDDAIAEIVIPPWFIAASAVTIIVNASLTGTGVAGTHTAQIKAYRTTTAGSQAANIGPGVASNITAAGADIKFAITGTTLNPGDRIMIELETIVQETGGAASLAASVNSVRFG